MRAECRRIASASAAEADSHGGASSSTLIRRLHHAVRNRSARYGVLGYVGKALHRPVHSLVAEGTGTEFRSPRTSSTVILHPMARVRLAETRPLGILEFRAIPLENSPAALEINTPGELASRPVVKSGHKMIA